MRGFPFGTVQEVSIVEVLYVAQTFRWPLTARDPRWMLPVDQFDPAEYSPRKEETNGQ